MLEYNYSNEPHGLVFMIDSKSFYASVESVDRGLNPLKSVLVVMSLADNTNGGLVLAASPEAKKQYGVSNVMRTRDVPRTDKIIVAEPRMNYYIEKNVAINNIFKEYSAEEDVHPYSIDESLLDMEKSWRLFGNTPIEVAQRIQKEVRDQLGIYLTVGIGDNPAMAKLALDLGAKKSPQLLSRWHYEDIPQKLWPITDLSSVWSIGKRTEKHLKRMGINSMYDLAHTNPYAIREELGVIGSQLFALSWGIDRSVIRQHFTPRSKSYGNSQVLPRDYRTDAELRVVIRELTEQVAARIRKHKQLTKCISLSVGFSYHEHDLGHHGFSKQMKIDATNQTTRLVLYTEQLFENNWNGEEVRNIAVYCTHLQDDNAEQLDLFQQMEISIKQRKLDATMDQLRKRFGIKKLVKLSSLTEGGTAIQRAGLVGGHRGGNAYE
ncbi:Y-family DNA polymerase [Pediococcus claussenii]|uniref:DNA-repair protein (SOS response UmuC-like protein) n=1 Tax=Pediococcus claussenii (strain ATCC BAA-344 / DSM 14800 / JCM 18046 / KCTC 3811 / LMG 21948 / P06) TaxID=701521 RepID=G8PB91_PEDCP|nr:Y-family DNA polymerase [Pediococcus claussenii]AEV94720.1 DNA-repair protein (SOS response UmuC-like protein) [Pediococcus claussenii ATCC BAA-344]ANZ69915.1 excinuclease ABC subunit A [Pediococcus claussenii]ANZ71732.1 excinuclease ABC subunit A [Pediococcus claussenii]